VPHFLFVCLRAVKVNETMLDMGVPETMPSYASVDIKPVFQEAYQNGGCKITCNGKPAWFKGQFPCFGKLAVRPHLQSVHAAGILITSTQGHISAMSAVCADERDTVACKLRRACSQGCNSGVPK